MKNNFLLVISLILFGVVVALFISWGQLSTAERSQLVPEIFKSLLQLATLLIIGGGITWLYNEATQERRNHESEKTKVLQRQAEVNALRKEILNRIYLFWLEFADKLRDYRFHTKGPCNEHRLIVTDLNELTSKLLLTAFELEITPKLFKKQEDIQQYIKQLISDIEPICEEEYTSQNKPPGELNKDDLYEIRPKYGYFRNHIAGFEKIFREIALLMREDILDPGNAD